MSYFFSIVIPVYNTEEELPRALDSIVNQDFDINKIEVIVINDASPKTAQCNGIIKEYSSKLTIKYLKNEVNQGTITTRKLGVENCSVREGWILFLDPDDYLEESACKVLYEDIQKNGYADYIQFNYYEVNEGVKGKTLITRNTYNRYIEGVSTFEQNHTLWNKCFNLSFMKNVCENTQTFYACYATDYYQFRIIDYYVKNIHFIEAPLYNYVMGNGITSEKYNKEKLKNIFTSIQNIEKHLCDFYQNKNSESYIPMVKNFSKYLYNYYFGFVNIYDFFDVYVEVLGIEKFKAFVIRHLDKLNDTIREYEKKMRLLLPIKIIAKPFRAFYRFCKERIKK